MSYMSGAPEIATSRGLPTAGKLIGGVSFAVVGWIAALRVLDTMPEGTPATFFPVTIAAIGLWQGWVAGSRVGKGWSAGLSNGVRTSVQMAFFGLLLFSLRTMFMRSANLRYDSPGEATVATLELFMQYSLQSLTAPIWATLLVGGLAAGLLTEIAGKLWR